MSPVVRLEQGLERVVTSPRLRTAAVVGSALLVLLFLLFRLDAQPISRKSEARTWEVARGMVGGGGWLVPRLDGEPRVKKPPLYYWAAAAAIAAEGDSPRALRLPSVLAAVGLVVTVFCWGRSAGGFASGALSALLLLLTIQFWTLGRRGDSEMTLAFFGMQALLAFDRIHWDRRRDLLPWFFAAFLLAFLAKATAAILVIGLPIAVRLSLDRAWRRVLRRDVLAWALACCAACLAWYAALLLWVPGAAAVLRESLLLPLGLAPPTDSAAHVRPVWYYVPGLLAAGAPAALLAPLAAWHVAARRDPTRARAGFPALAFATLFVALSAMPMKQKHYLMPLLPLLALSIAPAVRAAHERHRHACERTVAALGWGLLVIALPAALLPALHLAIAGEGAVAAVLVGGGVLGACAIGFASARRGSLRAFGLSVTMLTLTLVGVHLASFDPLRTSFRESVAPESIDFDAQRWSLVFARHPALRAFYHAEDWAGG